MRATFFVKLFLLCTLLSILLLLFSLQKLIKYKDGVVTVQTNFFDGTLHNIINKGKIYKKTESKDGDLKYILLWTSSETVPFVYMGKGRKGFLERKCPHTKCFVTDDRKYLGDYTKFDVIAFAGPEIVRTYKFDLPKKRSPHQKFVFASIESADNYPVCSDGLNDFFNWTWTYRMTSEAKWGYIVVRDAENKIIGPKTEMHWIKLEDMEPVSNEFKEQLKTKTKAAAWFVSNCYTRRHRERFVRDLQSELMKYNLTVDVYGRCGPFRCPSGKGEDCEDMLKRDYYFYLSFENSFSEDYVTEKLLHGVKNDVVPIVYGGANYTRFMPDGIYLNARELGVQNLAAKMNELINNPDEYAEYFRWKEYYTYYRRMESMETNDYCNFCSMLSDEKLVNSISMYSNFRQWWDPPNRC